MYNKKAMSPLIAGVLLVVMTVTVATLVSSWMKSTAKTQTEKALKNNDIECNYVYLAPENPEFNKTGLNELRFELYNRGDIDANINRITVIDNESNKQVFNNSYYIYAGDMELVILELNMSKLKNIYDVRIIPENCPSKAVEIEDSEITTY